MLARTHIVRVIVAIALLVETWVLLGNAVATKASSSKAAG